MSIRTFFAIVLCLSVASAAGAQDGVVPPPDYRELPDLVIFSDDPHGQWAGSGLGSEIETVPGPGLPVDEEVRFNELPSYRVNVEGGGGWWSFVLAGPNWEAFNIAPYYPDGALEFNVRGAVEGEDFQIHLNDIVNGRDPHNLASTAVSVSDYVWVTEEWQPVRIPLTAFLAGTGGFELKQMFSLSFASVSTEPITFWLNDIRFTTPAIEPGYPAIKLNQLGYLPTAPKIARVTGYPEELTAAAGTPFEVRSITTSEVVYQGSLELVSDFDAGASGERVLAADFSDLQTPGQYYLTVQAYQIDDSAPFAIGADLYNRLLSDSLHYFYLQRSGIEITPALAGPFARGAGHLQDAQAEFRSGAQPARDVSGGWYDAGDYGKYTNAGATAVSDLLWTYEMFPHLFGDGQLRVPETGNGIPDLLDEIRWELDWILKMQDPDTGGFYHMVQPTQEVIIPEALEPRFIEDVDGSTTNLRPTSTTASAVGALAHASLVFEGVDPDYAAALQTAAEAGWAYLEANPDPIGPMPGPYSDQDDVDDRFYAAAALFRLTGSSLYENYLAAEYANVDALFESRTDNGYGVGLMGMIGWLHVAHSPDIDPTLTAAFTAQFVPWFDHMTDRWQTSPWRLTLLDEDYYWGSNYVTLTTPLVMVVGQKALSDSGQLDPTSATISLNALDYLLGNNPLRFSYISGYGVDALERPFSFQWSWDGVADVPAGILAGGPNAYTNPLFYSNFPAKRYVDSSGSWTVNEHTVYWNAALVFHAALAATIGEQNAASFAAPPPPVAISDSESAAEPARVDPPAVPPAVGASPAEVAALQAQIDALEARLADQDSQPAAAPPPPAALPGWVVWVLVGWMGLLTIGLVIFGRRR